MKSSIPFLPLTISLALFLAQSDLIRATPAPQAQPSPSTTLVIDDPLPPSFSPITRSTPTTLSSRNSTYYPMPTFTDPDPDPTSTSFATSTTSIVMETMPTFTEDPSSPPSTSSPTPTPTPTSTSTTLGSCLQTYRGCTQARGPRNRQPCVSEAYACIRQIPQRGDGLVNDILDALFD